MVRRAVAAENGDGDGDTEERDQDQRGHADTMPAAKL
jgi:hypothetical protein